LFFLSNLVKSHIIYVKNYDEPFKFASDSGRHFEDFTVNSLYFSDMDTSGKILFKSDDNMNILCYN